MNESTRNQELTARLELLEGTTRRLERQVRGWKRLGMGVAACTVLLVGGGAAAIGTHSTIEAGEFVLRDQNHRVRAALALRPDGTPGLGLFDEAGHARLSVELGAQGAPSINLHDDMGRLRAALAMRPNGTPGLGLFDVNSRIRASLDVGNDGTSGANIYGADGILRAAMAIRADGTPGVGLFDETGRVIPPIDPEPVPERKLGSANTSLRGPM